MPIFTVFTPTYNRASTIGRVHESLLNQTFKDFEWVIVDDGSTDNTAELVKVWQAAAPFSIRYTWQKNGHKKTAFNRGVQEAHGEFFICVDSDDALTENALEILFKHWLSIDDNNKANFAGVSGLCVRPSGATVGDLFPTDVFDSNALEVFYKHKVKGDKAGFYRLDILKLYPFPQDVAGHVPESIVWQKIARKYLVRFINTSILVNYFSDSSLTTTKTYLSYKNNSEGHALWSCDVLSNDLDWFPHRPFWFFKMAANFTRFRMHMRDAGIQKEYHSNSFLSKTLVVIMYPVALLLYARDKIR